MQGDPTFHRLGKPIDGSTGLVTTLTKVGGRGLHGHRLGGSLGRDSEAPTSTPRSTSGSPTAFRSQASVRGSWPGAIARDDLQARWVRVGRRLLTLRNAVVIRLSASAPPCRPER
jgi:hypothetical protein